MLLLVGFDFGKKMFLREERRIHLKSKTVVTAKFIEHRQQVNVTNKLRLRSSKTRCLNLCLVYIYTS